MNSIRKRVEDAESAVNKVDGNSEKRLVALYPNSDEEYEWQKTVKLAELREKFGPSFAESHVIWIRVFFDGGPAKGSKD